MYLFPALTCEPVIGALEAFTKGILWVLEAVLTEPETEINTGKLAPDASAVWRTSKTITPSLGNLHHTLGQIPIKRNSYRRIRKDNRNRIHLTHHYIHKDYMLSKQEPDKV